MQHGQVVRRRGIGLVGGEVGITVAFLVAGLLEMLRGQPFDLPARLAASLILGPTVLQRPTGAAVALGVLILVALGALAGIFFALLCDWFPGLTQTPGTLVLAGATYAAFLWLLGFYLFGTLIWPWLTQTDPVVYVLAATASGVCLGGVFVLAGVHRSSQLD